MLCLLHAAQGASMCACNHTALYHTALCKLYLLAVTEHLETTALLPSQCYERTSAAAMSNCSPQEWRQQSELLSNLDGLPAAQHSTAQHSTAGRRHVDCVDFTQRLTTLHASPGHTSQLLKYVDFTQRLTMYALVATATTL
jgi:hypothetical protein